MKEIRLCMSASEETGEPLLHGLWMPESAAARESFEVLVAGNERYGPETHWVKERYVRVPGTFHARK